MAENKERKELSVIQPKSKIWIEAQGEVVFGGGRMALLLGLVVFLI